MVPSDDFQNLLVHGLHFSDEVFSISGCAYLHYRSPCLLQFKEYQSFRRFFKIKFSVYVVTQKMGMSPNEVVQYLNNHPRSVTLE